jgi:hypothetical protein
MEQLKQLKLMRKNTTFVKPEEPGVCNRQMRTVRIGLVFITASNLGFFL